MEYIFSTFITAAVFIFLILFLAASPKISKKFTVVALAVGGISGLLIYGYGYTVVTDNFFLAILKAVFAVFGSFVGNNDYASIAAAPFMQTEWMQIICAFVQLCALYATTSAVITAIGAEALKRFRIWFSRHKNINLIYGINDDALNLGKELVSKKMGIVIFIAEDQNPTANATISAMGCMLQSDSCAAKGDEKFLRKIGFNKGKRKLTLYALDKDSNSNIQYATRLLKSLEGINASANRLYLVLMGQEEVAISQLQQTPERYGYGFVTAVNEPEMAARLLIMKYPPYNAISFKKCGKAAENFHALLIGFGRVGQAVLKAIVMNGQFEGSNFKLDVFAPDIKKTDGNFTSQFSGLREQYDISFYDYDARSYHMYNYLNQHANKLRYIVISTGCEKTNHEIAEELISYFNTIGFNIPIYKCTKRGVDAYNTDGTVKTSHKLYNTELLCSHKIDEKAMILNHRYLSKTEKSPLQNWMECDYFSRQSCRAATDFIPALIRAAGKNSNQVRDGDWSLSKEQIENLSRTEHRRWCAFHYCMGFLPMDDTEFDARADIYRKQIMQDGKATIRIGKNMIARTHACLIPWEELDALSKKESAITGKDTDYKAMDTNNIMAIPQLMQINK